MTYTDKTVLITGVAGFLGRYVARHFFEQGWSVIGTDTSHPENAPLASLTSYVRLQLPDNKLGQILKEYSPYSCIHCAGRASVGLSVIEPITDFHANTILTLEILNALRLDAPKCRFINLSSAAVYGNPESLPVSEGQSTKPLSPYGFHKLLGEQLCIEFAKIYALSTASVRIFSAYGTGLRRQVMWDICHKAITKNSVTLQGTGKESRDFIHALDIANALHLIVTQAPMEGEVYNLATGREVTIAELAKHILKILEYEGLLKFDGVVPAGNPLNWRADISKLQRLGFSPQVSLERGINTFVSWCRSDLLGV